MDMNAKLINEGMSYLDSVKHCGDQMTYEMWLNDKKMRECPPIGWTKDQVDQAKKTAVYVNERN